MEGLTPPPCPHRSAALANPKRNPLRFLLKNGSLMLCIRLPFGLQRFPRLVRVAVWSRAGHAPPLRPTRKLRVSVGLHNRKPRCRGEHCSPVRVSTFGSRFRLVAGGACPAPTAQQKNNALSPAPTSRVFQTCAHGAHTKFFIFYLLSFIFPRRAGSSFPVGSAGAAR